jgi:hypothetical protein
MNRWLLMIVGDVRIKSRRETNLADVPERMLMII